MGCEGRRERPGRNWCRVSTGLPAWESRPSTPQFEPSNSLTAASCLGFQFASGALGDGAGGVAPACMSRLKRCQLTMLAGPVLLPRYQAAPKIRRPSGIGCRWQSIALLGITAPLAGLSVSASSRCRNQYTPSWWRWRESNPRPARIYFDFCAFALQPSFTAGRRKPMVKRIPPTHRTPRTSGTHPRCRWKRVDGCRLRRQVVQGPPAATWLGGATFVPFAAL